MRKLLLSLLVLCVVPAVFSRGMAEEVAPAASGHDAPALTILAPSTVSTVPFLALIDRYPDEYQLEFFTDHPQALARLIQGEVDLLATGFSVGYGRFQNAGDIMHLFTPVWGVSAIMTSEPVSSLAELAGGVIYAPFEGSPIDIFLQAILEADGLTGRVEIAYAPFPQAAALVVQGNADAAVLVEPIASRVELSGGAYRLENLHDGWARVSGGEQRSPQVSLFAGRRSAEERSGEHALLEDRLRQIVEEILQDPAPFAQQFAADLGVPVEVTERALANTLFGMPDHAETVRLISAYARAMGLSDPGAGLHRPGE